MGDNTLYKVGFLVGKPIWYRDGEDLVEGIVTGIKYEGDQGYYVIERKQNSSSPGSQ